MKIVPLQAGPLQMAFLPEEGALHWIYAGAQEVLRGIGAPVRDHVWATVRPSIDDLRIDARLDSFRVTFTARCRQDPLDFRWRGEITGNAEGVLVFDLNGEALTDFQRNRIGFCVLYPAETAGTACVIEHTDGTKEAARLPDSIQPHQPFLDIRAITTEVMPSMQVEVRMEGDTFEMEDQRNWTDASFKTYCTPLALPLPVRVAKGSRLHQRVTLRVLGRAERIDAGFVPRWAAPPEVSIRIGARLPSHLPALGVAWTKLTASSAILARLRELRLAHLRVDVQLADAAHADLLRAAHAAAEQIGAGLELAVHVDDQVGEQFARLRRVLEGLAPTPRIARWLVFHERTVSTPPEVVKAWRAIFRDSAFSAPVGGGSTDNFTELNRNRGVAIVADLTVHGCNPQVHMFDDAALFETLAIQGLAVRQARDFSGGHSASVSPITLASRWQCGETGAPAARPAGLMPFRSDRRLDQPLAAAWMLGSLAALTASGASSATYFEAVGENGVIASDGSVRPVAEVFKAVAPLTGAFAAEVVISHPAHVGALALADDHRRFLLLANYHAADQHLRVHGAWGDLSLTLPPYGIACRSVA